MKKTAKMILVIACVLAMGSTAFAGAYTSAEGEGALALGAGSATTAPILTIGLSPKVRASYFTDGTSAGTAQWYAIGTVHPGGTEVYGTAQNLNNVYKRTFTTGTTIDTAFFGLPSGPNSASDWSDNGWKL